ncbi:MAG: hypothetical protein PHH14_04460 [Candidatus Margulisbacteria bacterium]|nr:hypothetical protein [Candidatus Margulisiibacteriota bacterium]
MKIDRLLSKFNKLYHSYKKLPSNVIDGLERQGLRIGFVRDLEQDLSLPENKALAGASERFMALFQGERSIIHREVVSWNWLTNERVGTGHWLSDAKTSLNLKYLYNSIKSQPYLCNLACPEISQYFADSSSFLYRALESRDYAGLSLPFGFSSENVRFDYSGGCFVPMTPVIEKFQMMRRTLDILANIQLNLKATDFKGELMIEPLGYQPALAYGKGDSAFMCVTDPEFIAEALNRSGWRLLFDVAHLLISAGNMGYNAPLEYVERMMAPPGRQVLREIRLTVPQKREGLWGNSRQPFFKLDTSEAADVASTLEYLILNRPKETPLAINFGTPVETVDQDAFMLVLFLREVLGF